MKNFSMESVTRTLFLARKPLLRLPLLRLPLALIGLAAVMASAEHVSGETWTSLRGNRTVQARMAGMWDNHVVLIMANGRQVNVPLDSLDAESRIQAKKLAVKLEEQRQSLTRELRGAAEAEAAAAPDPLPEPPAAEPYSPPNPNLKPDAAISVIQDQLAAGHLVVLYDSMPLKFRGELDGLVALLMKKLESSAWNDSMTQLHRLSDLIVTRQNWILSYPRLLQDGAGSSSPNQIGEIFQSLILPTASLVRAGLPPDATTPDAITSSGFGAWLRQRDEVIAPYLAPILQRYSSQNYSWSLLDDTGEQTVLQATGQGAGNNSPVSVEMKKVDGYWIPASLADGFTEWVQTRTAELEKYDDGTMSVSAWLGGESIGTASLASSSTNDPSMSPNAEFGSGFDEDFDEMMEAEMEMGMEMGMNESFGGRSSGYSSSSRGKPGEFAKPVVSGEMLGTMIQTLGGVGGIIGPLEAAPDKATFHQAIQQTASPITSMIDMLGR